MNNAMNHETFHKAYHIARNYFEARGYCSIWLMRALSDYIVEMYEKGERRPLVLGNRAIAKMERALKVMEEQLCREAATMMSVC